VQLLSTDHTSWWGTKNTTYESKPTDIESATRSFVSYTLESSDQAMEGAMYLISHLTLTDRKILVIQGSDRRFEVCYAPKLRSYLAWEEGHEPVLSETPSLMMSTARFVQWLLGRTLPQNYRYRESRPNIIRSTTNFEALLESIVNVYRFQERLTGLSYRIVPNFTKVVNANLVEMRLKRKRWKKLPKSLFPEHSRSGYVRSMRQSIYLHISGLVYPSLSKETATISEGGFKRVKRLKTLAHNPPRVIYSFLQSPFSTDPQMPDLDILGRLKRGIKAFKDSNYITTGELLQYDKTLQDRTITVTKIIDLEYKCDLHRLITKHTIDTRNKFQLMLDLCHGVEEIHSKNWVHFDLKTRNILVNKVAGIYRAKIADFDLAHQDHEIVNFVAGTPEYMAPEFFRCIPKTAFARAFHRFVHKAASKGINGAAQGQQTDIYSLGFIFCNIWKGCNNMNLRELYESSQKVPPSLKAVRKRAELDKHDPIQKLIATMLDPRSTKRPKIEEVHQELETLAPKYS